VSEEAAKPVKGGACCPPCFSQLNEAPGDAEIQCEVCRELVARRESREIKGITCCPGCHEKLRAKLKEKEKETAAPEPKDHRVAGSRAPERPSAARAGTREQPSTAGQPVVRRPMTSSEKLIARAGAVQGRGLAGGLPDLPPEFLNSAPRSADGRGPGFGIGPAWIGRAIYTALAGLILWGVALGVAGEGDGRRAAVLVLAGLAAGLGVPAVGIGIAEAVRSGEVVKQVFGGIGIALGLFLVFYVGANFVSDLKRVPHPMDAYRNGKPERDPAEPGGTASQPPTPGTGTAATAPASPANPGPATATAPTGTATPPSAPTGTPPAPLPAPGPIANPQQPAPDKPAVQAPRIDPRSALRQTLRKALAAAAAEARKLDGEAEVLAGITEQRISAIDFSTDIAADPVEGHIDVATGTGPARRFLYSARKAGEGGAEREVVSLGIPDAAVRAEKHDDGWKLVVLETTNPLIRYRRGLRGLDATSLPTSAFGMLPGGTTLKPYGRMVLGGGEPREITPGAGGLLLALPRETGFADLLAAATKYDARKGLALLVVGSRGQIYPLPEITAEERQGQLRTVTLELLSKVPGSWDVRLAPATYRADQAGMANLVSRIKDLANVGGRPGGLPVKIAPAKDSPVELLVKVVDCCLQAGVRAEAVTIHPGG
jgi:hypothetical protein